MGRWICSNGELFVGELVDRRLKEMQDIQQVRHACVNHSSAATGQAGLDVVTGQLGRWVGSPLESNQHHADIKDSHAANNCE